MLIQRLIHRFYQHDIAVGGNGTAEIESLPIEGEEQSRFELDTAHVVTGQIPIFYANRKQATLHPSPG